MRQGMHNGGRFYYNAAFWRRALTTWVLGLDIGQHKTGVAVGQSLTGSATPLGIIRKPAQALQIQDIRPWVQEWRVQHIIIGRPRLADGKPHPLDPAIDRMAHLMLTELGLPVHEVDEYLSSHEAKARQPKKDAVDAIAACILIEDFFAQTARIMP